MGALIALMAIAVVAYLIVRIGSTALYMTGLSRDVAIFQACSAFFGVGFTTREAEFVVDHPVRRRIVTHLIIAGNIGLTSALATIIVTFVQLDEQAVVRRAVEIIIGLVILLLLARSKLLSRMVDRSVQKAMGTTGRVISEDYELLLNLREGYIIGEMSVDESSGLAGKTLRHSGLGAEGLLVLAIERAGGETVGTPRADTELQAGDVLVTYGKNADLERYCRHHAAELGSRSI